MPDTDRELLIASVREAGTIARTYFSGRYKIWRKTGGDPVTEADIAIDSFLKERLIAARPDYGWLSEETADDRARLDRTRTFVVDPIDGTYGFVKGQPQFTIVAAVVAKGRPIAGAIYNPITEEMFEAESGGGARKNGAAIHVGRRTSLADARLLATRKFADPEHWRTPWPQGITLESRASIAYRMGLVAEGAFDAMISLSRKSDWDLAAGDLIVQEAGGRVTTDCGETLVYNKVAPEQRSVICAGPAVHELLVARLREHTAPPA